MERMKLKKIALLGRKKEISQDEIDRLQRIFLKNKIDLAFFEKSEDIDFFEPDCVIAMTPQDAKLTHYPTYGLMDRPVADYLELPRFVRNVLTYDAYLTISPKTKQALQDMIFGARKLGSLVSHFSFSLEKTFFREPDLRAFQLMYYEQNLTNSNFSHVYKLLLARVKGLKIVCDDDYFTLSQNEISVQDQYYQAGVGLCLDIGDIDSQVINNNVLNIIASSAVTITAHSELLEKYFGDSLLYINTSSTPAEVCNIVEKHLLWIKNNHQQALEKVRRAHEVFCEHFSLNHFITELNLLHNQVLLQKGYISDINQKNPEQLPSVSYIIRTGGRYRPHLERALSSLVGQDYPKLQVIFVIYKDFDFMHDLIAQYPTLKFKVVCGYNSLRSTAICDGMAAVETDLFGLLDDDDDLHPNHVRTLVKTLRYHDKRDWRGSVAMAYSGSIIVHETDAVHEREEFRDLKLENRGERRVIEHYRFYRPNEMAKHEWFMMSNSWLAKSSLIDEELLTDPEIDTCEDLYFELQLAQRTHFAFSGEMTVFHHFHRFGNSTIVDSNRHIPDTQRIAMRNFGRTFSADYMYDTPRNLIGRKSSRQVNNYAYQNNVKHEDQNTYFYIDPIYPQRASDNIPANFPVDFAKISRFLQKIVNIMRVILLPILLLREMAIFLSMKRHEKKKYLDKVFKYLENYGYYRILIYLLFIKKTNLNRSQVLHSRNKISKAKKTYFYGRIYLHYFGWRKTLRKIRNKFFSKKTLK